MRDESSSGPAVIVTELRCGPSADAAVAAPRRPLRLGFLGLGWIGLHRLKSLLKSADVEVVAVADPAREAVAAARQLVPEARAANGLEELLREELDGLVIATPSALHAEQACAALERGWAVFCQKPLARTAAETRMVVNEARRNDRLLAVDYCYRHLNGMESMRRLIQGGELGRLFFIDLIFHNAYGPDKAWFYDARQSGGGCLMDLGTHLVDLAMWLCDCPEVERLSSQLYRCGEPLDQLRGDGQECPSYRNDEVEDAAFAQWRFQGGIHVRLACSWKLSAGKDAEIGAAFYGTGGAAVLRNVHGSFYDFAVEHHCGTRCQRLASPPDDWGGRALQHWATRLAGDRRFDPDARHYLQVAELLDAMYGR